MNLFCNISQDIPSSYPEAQCKLIPRPIFLPLDMEINYIYEKYEKQAGAELCQAQFGLGLAKPAVAMLLPIHEPAMLAFYLAS
jgi:hypothetical protein